MKAFVLLVGLLVLGGCAVPKPSQTPHDATGTTTATDGSGTHPPSSGEPGSPGQPGEPGRPGSGNPPESVQGYRTLVLLDTDYTATPVQGAHFDVAVPGDATYIGVRAVLWNSTFSGFRFSGLAGCGNATLELGAQVGGSRDVAGAVCQAPVAGMYPLTAEVDAGLVMGHVRVLGYVPA